MSMKINILIAVFVGLLGYAGTYYFTYMTVPKGPAVSVDTGIERKKGVDVPDFAFVDLEGVERTLADFSGKVIVLNFWASWCPPCIKEFPDLLDITAKYKKDVAFVAVSSDYKPENMHRFLDKMRAQKPFAENVYITLDENNKITQSLYGAYRIPVTIVISQDFKAVHKFIGISWTPEELENVIKTYL